MSLKERMLQGRSVSTRFVSTKRNISGYVLDTCRTILCFLLLLFSSLTFAQSYQVYIDADVDDATGCAVSLSNAGGNQNFVGFEYRLGVSVTGTTVSSTTLSTCSGSSFGGAGAVGSSHPLAITDIGTAVTDHIELGLPLTSLTVSNNSVKLVIATTGDYIATVAPAGGPIIMPLAFSGGEPHGIPLLPPIALALLGLAVGFLGWRNHKKHHLAAMCLCLLISGTLLSASLAWAAGRIPFDGNLTGWGGIPVLATGNTGDHSGSVDLLKLYAAVDDGQIKLRIDANSGRASTQPPTPTPIPGDPLSAKLPTLSVTGVQHLAINQPWVLNLTAKDSSGTVIPVTVHPNSAHPSEIGISGANPLIFNWTPNNSHIGQHIIKVTATDSDGRTIVHDLLIAVTDPTDLPANPATVATPLLPGATPFDEAIAFIYDGQDPIQKGVASGTIDPIQAGVVRGLVKDRNNQPMAGVTVRVLNHPEYGTTKTRADGWFDLAVNGGGILVIDYQKPGYLRAQRKIDVPWRDYAITEDVVLITLDSKTTPVTMNSSDWQAAIGTETDDSRGKRTAVVLFPPNTTAMLKFSDGTTKALDHLTFRTSEYTIGDNGPDTMPGELPISVGYTYAVELSADEAISTGAQHVEFSQPVPLYVDNFLNFAPGIIVPMGWYDYERGAWIGSDNGRVIKILSVADGKAVLQVTEESRAATAAELIALGITDEEREALAKMYTAGKSLWRTQVSHFSPWDCNWPVGLPNDASQSATPIIRGNQGTCQSGKDCSCPDTGCDIYQQDRAVGQAIEIPGSPFNLYYRSDRSIGMAYPVPITAEDSTSPASLQRFEARVDIAGQRIIHEILPPFIAGTTWHFPWDGKDAYGRTIYTGSKAKIEVIQYYPEIIYATASEARASTAPLFSILDSRPAASNTAIGRSEWGAAVIRSWNDFLPANGSAEVALSHAGGWALEGLKFYDPSQRRLYTGGDRLKTAAASPWQFVKAEIHSSSSYLSAIAAPDGNIIAITTNHEIVAIDRDGYETVLAGGNGQGFAGDGGPADQAQLNQPQSLTPGIDGSLYFLDQNGTRIRHIDPQGIIRTVVGNGTSGTPQPGDALTSPLSATVLVVDRDGNLFFNNGALLHQVTNTGELVRVATMSATIMSLAVEPAGGLWVGTNNHIYFIAPGGDTTLEAGGGSETGDGSGLLLGINPSSLIPDRNGNVYCHDGRTGRGRFLDHGVVTSLTGSLQGAFRMSSGDFWRVSSGRLEKMSSGIPGYEESWYEFPHENGLYLDQFDREGRHTATINRLTGAATATLEYDSNGHVTAITDADGNRAEFERDADGRLNAIVGIDGERSTLSYDADGRLIEVQTPLGTHRMNYGPHPYYPELLTAYTDPRGNTDRFNYDDTGLLMRNVDPVGGGWTLSTETKEINSWTTYQINTLTSAKGRQYRYASDQRTGMLRETVAPDGLATTIHEFYDSNWYRTHPDGSRTWTYITPDPKYGMIANSKAVSVEYGDGLHITTRTNRQASQDFWIETESIGGTVTSTTDGSSYSTRYFNGQLTYATPIEAEAVIVRVDDQLRPLMENRPDLATLQYSYDVRGRLESTSAFGQSGTRTTRFSYHTSAPGKGKLAGVTNALGQTIVYAYDLAGRLQQITQPDGRSLAYGYDANGNLIELITSAGISHRFQYDGINQPVSYDAPQSSTLRQYNLDRELTGIVRPGGQAVTFSYDTGGRLSTQTTAEGQTNWHYNSKGQLDSITGRDATLTFSRSGTLTTGTSWDGTINGSVADSLDVYQRLLPTQKAINAGAMGFTMHQKFDAADRLTGITVYSRNSVWSPVSVALGYARNGGVAGFSLGKYADSYQYNDFGEVGNAFHAGPAIFTTPDLEASRLAFIAKSNVLKSELLAEISRQGTCVGSGWFNTDPDQPGWYVNELSDEDIARLTEEYGAPTPRSPSQCSEWVSGMMDSYIIGYATYLPADQWTSEVVSWLPQIADGMRGGAAAIVPQMTDTTSLMSTEAESLLAELMAIADEVRNQLPNLGFVGRFNYQRDLLGRITDQQEMMLGISISHQYEYDPAGRLVAHIRNGQRTEWGYDANSNRTTENGQVIAEFDNEDRMTRFGGNTYGYNAAGDLTSKNTPSGITRYTYDSLGNLTQVQLPGSLQIDYLVDPVNRRIGKKKNGQLQYGLLYQDNLRPVAELKPDGEIRSLFIYADKGNVPSAMLREGKSYRIISDHLGSVRVVIDTTANTIIQRIDYDVWGRITQDTNPGFQPFGFAGGLYDPDTGLTRFGARDYDAETGRWTAKDPILFNGGDTNLYGYVLQDPINSIDPSGLFNPVKGWIAVQNFQIAVGSFIGGTQKMVAGVEALSINPALAPVFYGLAAWNFHTSSAAWERTKTTWKEAWCEDWGDASWQNLYGLLPGGTQYDDAKDPYSGPIDYIENQGIWEFIKEAGYF